MPHEHANPPEPDPTRSLPSPGALPQGVSADATASRPVSNDSLAPTATFGAALSAGVPVTATWGAAIPAQDVATAPYQVADQPLPVAPVGYVLLGELGRGGMGVVYRAKQTALNRVVALKVVLAGGHASPEQRRRFLAEAEVVASLNHSGVVQVYEFGTWDGQPYMALEYCEGGTLAAKLGGTPLPPREAATLVEQLSRAVAAAHAKSVIHRDLKPLNVLLTAGGVPKVADFGLAKMTESGAGVTATGAVLGTPSYMAPEQARGDTKNIGFPADVYALGAILYETLTGRPPFKGVSAAETILQVLEQEPVGVRVLNPLVPTDLETVCLKCLEKDPARRYRSATELGDDIQRFLQGRQVLARPVGTLERASKWVRRNPAVTGLLTAVFLSLLAGTGATYVKYLDEAKQRNDANQQREAAKLSEAKAVEEATAKDQALTRLTAATRETEAALLRGLLRPIKRDPSVALAADEVGAFRELAFLPDKKLRLWFVEYALKSADGALKLSARPGEVVHAVVGMDRNQLAQLRELVVRVLRSPESEPSTRVACGLLLSELPPGDPAFDALAAEVVSENMLGERNPFALAVSGQALAHLTVRLSPAEAVRVVFPPTRVLASRLAGADLDSRGVRALSQTFTVLLGRLPPREVAILTGLATKGLASRMALEPNHAVLASLVDGLSLLSPRLQNRDAVFLSLACVDRMTSSTDAAPVRVMRDALKVLNRHLADEDRYRLAEAVGKSMSGHAHPSVVEPLAGTLLFLTGRNSVKWVQGREVINSVSERLVERSRKETDPLALGQFARGVGILGHGLDAQYADNITRLLAARLTELEEAGNVDELVFASFVQAIAAVVRGTPLERLNREKSLTPVVGLLINQLTTEDPQGVTHLGRAIETLAPELVQEHATRLAVKVAEEAALTGDSRALESLARATAALARHVVSGNARVLRAGLFAQLARKATGMVGGSPPRNMRAQPSGELTKLTSPASRTLATRLAVEKESLAAADLAWGITALADCLDPGDALLLTGVLTNRMREMTNPVSLAALARALTAVAGQFDATDGAAVVIPHVRMVAVRIQAETDPAALRFLTQALDVMLRRLTPEEADAVVFSTTRVVVARLAIETDKGILEALAGATQLLSNRQAALDVDVRALAERMSRENDPTALRSLARAITTVAARLTPHDAARVARSLANRVAVETDLPARTELQFALAMVATRMSDADIIELVLDQLPFEAVRTALLTTLSNRSGGVRNAQVAVVGAAPAFSHPPSVFKDAWAFMNWVETKHPDRNVGPEHPPLR